MLETIDDDRPMLVDAGWPLDRIGAVSIVGSGTAAVLASLASGALLTRLGRRRTVVAFGLVTVVATMALFPLAQARAARSPGWPQSRC